MPLLVRSIHLNYKGKKVQGKKLIIYSKIPLSIEQAWHEVQKSRILEFIAKGMLTLKPINGNFPNKIKEGLVVKIKMFLFGCIPFGGIHTLKIIKIDPINKILLTNEYDKVAKIWNHKIVLKKLTSNTVEYQDEIDLYGGVLTPIILIWAKLFFKHRHKRWLLVAKGLSS